MPDIMKDFAHLDTWSDDQLFNRQAEIKASVETLAALSDEALQELLAIARVLRRRTTSPTAKSSGKARAVAPSLDAL